MAESFIAWPRKLRGQNTRPRAVFGLKIGFSWFLMIFTLFSGNFDRFEWEKCRKLQESRKLYEKDSGEEKMKKCDWNLVTVETGNEVIQR